MEFLILLVSLFSFLFILHYYVRDDFVIFRKNVSLEDVFNIAFMSFILVFLSSRLLYIVENPSPVYINPLVFLAVFYYPGLALTGGIIGGGLFVIWYVKRKKFPGKRILDFFSIAALWAINIYSLLYIILLRKFFLETILQGALFFALLGIFSLFLIPKYLAGKIKDGFLTGFFCIGYSLISLVSLFLGKRGLPGIIFETAFLIIIFSLGLIFILKEQLAPKIKDLK